MPKNSHLNLARKLKRDEFYTCRSTVEDELRHYTKHFKGKTVLCNCDDDEYSEFFKYFYQRFDFLGLKKLIGVHYEGEKDENGKYKFKKILKLVPMLTINYGISAIFALLTVAITDKVSEAFFGVKYTNILKSFL